MFRGKDQFFDLKGFFLAKPLVFHLLSLSPPLIINIVLTSGSDSLNVNDVGTKVSKRIGLGRRDGCV